MTRYATQPAIGLTGVLVTIITTALPVLRAFSEDGA